MDSNLAFLAQDEVVAGPEQCIPGFYLAYYAFGAIRLFLFEFFDFGIVADQLGLHCEHLSFEGIDLFVHNANSLLTGAFRSLPISLFDSENGERECS